MSKNSIRQPPDPAIIECVKQTIINNAEGRSHDSHEFKLAQEIQKDPHKIIIAIDRGVIHSGGENHSTPQKICDEAVKFLKRGTHSWIYEAVNYSWPQTNMKDPSQ